MCFFVHERTNTIIAREKSNKPKHASSNISKYSFDFLLETRYCYKHSRRFTLKHKIKNWNLKDRQKLYCIYFPKSGM